MTIKFNFFGKNCIIDRELADRKDANRALVNIGFEASHLLLLNQVHGCEVAVIDEQGKIYGDQNLPKVDALVTNLSDVVIGVITADCAPVLLFDEQKNVIGASHAGWKGARAGIIKSTIAAMKNLGAENISVIIGPMIQQNSYEVSVDFFEDFMRESANNQIFFINGNEGKYLFDLPAYVEKKLTDEGVIKIQNLKIDTYKEVEKFFSFRRSCHNGESDCGRNLSVIGVVK